MSFITSEGLELANQENCWWYRDYELLKKRIQKEVNLNEDVYNSFSYYVLYCSKNDISSLIWIPKDKDRYSEAIKEGIANHLSKTTFNIVNQAYGSLINVF